MDEEVVFYNDLYSGNPDIWTKEYRDETAYLILSQHILIPKTLLDIGCGSGHTIEYFSERLSQIDCYGVDLSDVAIELAKKRVPEATFVSGSYTEVEMPYCDVVLLMGIAEHFEDLVGSLRGLKEYGKHIYIESPNCLSYIPDSVPGFRTTAELVGANTSAQREWHITRDSWEDKIREAGLKIIKGYTGPTPETEFIWVLK